MVKEDCSLLTLKLNLPTSIFNGLTQDQFINLCEYIGEENGFSKFLYKNRAAWYWQQRALLNFFSKSRFHVNEFEPGYMQVPTDEQAVKSIKIIEEFNKKYNLVEKSLVYSPFEMNNEFWNTNYNIQAHLIESNRILKIVYKKLKEYNYIFEFCPNEFRNGWEHFYSVYKNSLFENLKSTIDNLIIGYNDKERYRIFYEHTFLNFLKILILFAGSLNNSNIMENKDLEKTYTSPFVVFGKKVRQIYHNPTNLMERIKEALPAIDDFIVTCAIPPDFQKEYTKYYAHEITKKEICTIFNITEHTFKKWIEELGLPTKSTPQKTSNLILADAFKKEYMRYYNKEIKKKDLFEKFNISQKDFTEWRNTLDLPVVDYKNANVIKIPENFQETYMSFFNGEISKEILIKKLNVSVVTICKWRDKFNLPWAQEACRTSLGKAKELTVSESTAVSVEPPVQVFPVEKPTFKFNLFGYEFSFKAKKKEPPEPINLSDEFPDEVEY